MPHRFLPVTVISTILAGLIAPGAVAGEMPTVLPGFTITRLVEATKVQGSWICIAEDAKGRFTVSAQNGPLQRLTLTGDQIAAQKLESPVTDAMGLLWLDGALYANGKGPQGRGLYRMRDADDDGTFEEATLLMGVKKGGGEHGEHGVVLGPDRRLYVVCGNHTTLPEGLTATSPYRNYQEDFLLPRQFDANGHARGIMAPGGFVVRMDPDGKNPELFCAGFRNTYDIAFNADGDLFAYDSDMEWEIGMPWYRPTRILHCSSGAEFGWRSGSGKWPVTHIDSLGPVVDMGPGSPTGVCFGTGAKFPPRWQRAMFSCDWALGTIHAVHLTADGAGWKGVSEPFITGKPLNVTDLTVARDGALYFVTGGRGTQSALFRVTWTGTDAAAPPAAGGGDERALRRRLEAFHATADASALDVAWPYLDSADRSLRFAARLAVERQGVASWQARALAEARPRAALAALTAVARYAAKEAQGDLFARLAALDWTTLDRQQRLEWARVHALAGIRMGKPEAAVAAALAQRLAPLIPSGDFAVDRELLELLIFLESPAAPARGLIMANTASSPSQALGPIFSLRSATAGWTPELRTAYLDWYSTFEDLKGGHSMVKQLALMRSEAIATIPADEKAKIPAALLAPKPPVFKVPPPPRVGAKLVQKWTVAELEPKLDGAAAGRSHANGQGWFMHLCAQCHRVGGVGSGVGPDLTGAGKRFSRRDLIEAIVDPGKIVSDQYLHLQRMPPALIDKLTIDEILDLVAWLENGGDAQAKPFAGAGAAP